MQLDFKSDSQQFALKHGCFPAATVRLAMEHGASVAVAQMAETIRNLRLDLKQAQFNGRSNWETKLIEQ